MRWNKGLWSGSLLITITIQLLPVLPSTTLLLHLLVPYIVLPPPSLETTMRRRRLK